MIIIQYIKAFCERHLVADNPWPYAEFSTEQLIGDYSLAAPKFQSEIKRELDYRFKAGMLSYNEIAQYIWLEGAP